MSTAAPTFKLEDIQTGEFFSIELPSRFNRTTTVVILGKKIIGDDIHYRVMSVQPMLYNYTNVSSAPLNAPFSIILKSGDEDAIREVFKYWDKDQWKTLVHYGKLGYYDDWSDIFEYIFEMKGREQLVGLLQTIEDLGEKGAKNGRHQNNKLRPVESKLIKPSELENGKTYLLEKVFEAEPFFGWVDIITIKSKVTDKSGKTFIEYRQKDGLPFNQKAVLDSTNIDSNTGGQFYFYKRPTIEEAMKYITLSDDRIRLFKFRKNTRAEKGFAPENKTGVRNYRFPPREGPPIPPKANVNASKKPQTGGKRKTQRQRRMAKKSRKQRKN